MQTCRDKSIGSSGLMRCGGFFPEREAVGVAKADRAGEGKRGVRLGPGGVVWAVVIYGLGWGLAVVQLAGCVSEAEARRQAEAAFIQGQIQAREARQQPPPAAVFFRGNVRNAIVAWEDGMTLAEAILEADYQGVETPRTIRITSHTGESFSVDPERLLRGEDYFLEAGDVIWIEP